MDLPLNVDVHCTDGICGRSTRLVLDPLERRATHLVVREKGAFGIERLVPLGLVRESTPTAIQLDCDLARFHKHETFLQNHYITADDYWIDEMALPMDMEWEEAHVLWPYAWAERHSGPVEVENLPSGEVAIQRGAHVQTTDGSVGTVDELVVDRESGRITHLRLRTGHPWSRHEVTIPVSAIERIEEDRIYLTLNHEQVDRLPHQPVRRAAPFHLRAPHR